VFASVYLCILLCSYVFYSVVLHHHNQCSEHPHIERIISCSAQDCHHVVPGRSFCVADRNL